MKPEITPERGNIAGRICTRMLLFLIRVYQVTLSPLLGGHCRYVPTCSQYALEAIQEHGPWRGSALAIKRLLRCHPFVKGGYDPVPPRHKEKS
jgi:putative membrane protein insertion efficiency factor